MTIDEAIESLEKRYVNISMFPSYEGALAINRPIKMAVDALRKQQDAEKEHLTAADIAKEYMSICDNDCIGDPSVGITPCPFYEYPDKKEDGSFISGCKLKNIIKP